MTGRAGRILREKEKGAIHGFSHRFTPSKKYDGHGLPAEKPLRGKGIR